MPAYPSDETRAIGGVCRYSIDEASGKLAGRPELGEALLVARKGDQLVVTPGWAGSAGYPRSSGEVALPPGSTRRQGGLAGYMFLCTGCDEMGSACWRGCGGWLTGF